MRGSFKAGKPQKGYRKGYKRRRGLFPWRPQFPSRVTGEWDEWYHDWIDHPVLKSPKLDGHRKR
jgi:hypothetical protein